MEQSMNRYIGQMLDDRYEILEIIGSGGMSVVYKAMCHKLHRYVAVKILRDEMAADAELKNRFQAEAHAVAMLSQPNIVSVYDVGHSGETEYIVMELIEGETLKQRMAEHGVFSATEALHYATQICKALQHAHAHGIVHRDIKPQNIMITNDDMVKVADFGIAALENIHEERSGQAIGSVHYIAPEQAKGLNADARSDLYSSASCSMRCSRATCRMTRTPRRRSRSCTSPAAPSRRGSGTATSPRSLSASRSAPWSRICASAISRRGRCSKRSMPAKSTSISSVRLSSGGGRARRKRTPFSVWVRI
ncbi:MAG: protein kinase domain-containing protein [Oscillospiraceae bacterium]